jgi:hypothetical protein
MHIKIKFTFYESERQGEGLIGSFFPQFPPRAKTFSKISHHTEGNIAGPIAPKVLKSPNLTNITIFS